MVNNYQIQVAKIRRAQHYAAVYFGGKNLVIHFKQNKNPAFLQGLLITHQISLNNYFICKG